MVTVRLFAIGESRVDALPIPDRQQLTLDEVVDFCVKRFKGYQREKSSVGQWPEDGKRLQADSVGSSPHAGIRRSFSLHAKRGDLGNT